MNDENINKSAGNLLTEAMSNVSGLVRSEVDLARAEISENVTKAGVAVGLIAGAAIIALVALNVLAAALVAALTEAGLDAGWSALIVGAGLAIIAFVLINKGVNDLKLSSLAPTRTVKNVQRDAAAVKEAYDDK
ncbi:phage holin family protein [Actibacterium sp. 188UL27-1]|uniref:phage holin family protein n=1 Tax=Actibacterium sp. 188UL27-1 TaxID=2786961 RepID=UPI001957C243|nr:phage holin family protein [Actibacterium sp. 188UL27-1]MBM7070081.1 phage holin family protein [Actibacterium sp. 188UL27-1]